MANQYLVLALVKVDRGIIGIGTVNQGKHIPYWAGLVIQNQKTFKKEFLDTYNSEVLLRSVFEYKFNGTNPSLGQIISENRQFLETNISFVVVKDLEKYIQMNDIIVSPRNKARMERMAERMKTIPFNFV